MGLLGMKLETFGQGRKAFVFGQQKINLHVKGSEFRAQGAPPVPGALDLCFICAVPLDEVIARVRASGRGSWKGRCRARAPAIRSVPSICGIRT